MFNGDKTLRGKDEVVRYSKQNIEEIIKCQEDILYFAEHYFHIITLDEGKRLISLWEFQKKILKCLVEVPDNKKNVCLCASRQIGKSTMISVYVLWRILFCKEYRIALLANKEKLAMELLDRIKLAFSLLPKFLQVGVTEWNEKSISLENLSTIEASSTSSSAVRGLTLNELILDEFAFVAPNIQQKLTSSVIPTISSGKRSKVIMSSTPNGLEMFANTFFDAIHDKNNYYAIKVLWNEVPNRDEEWKKSMISSLPGGDLQFIQEFDCKFFGAANTLVDNGILEKIRPQSPIEFKWSGLVTIFENPLPNVKYIAGVDPSGGLKKNYSVIQILKVSGMKKLEQVAMFRSNTHSPYDLATFVIELSDYYNKCQVLVENNSDVGGILCSQLFHHYEFDRLIFVDGKMGIRSSKNTKAEGNYLLKRYLEHGWLKINDRTTIYELSLYKEQSLGCFASDRNCTDDTVTSLLWSLVAIHLPEVSQEFFDEAGNVIEGNANVADNFVALFD